MAGMVRNHDITDKATGAGRAAEVRRGQTPEAAGDGKRSGNRRQQGLTTSAELRRVLVWRDLSE